MKLKLSRPVIYIAVAAAIGAGVYFYTEPAAIVKKPAVKKASLRQAEGIPGILPEDFELKFSGVAPSSRDLFRPLVSRTTTTRGAADGAGFGSGGWRLTGISIVDGQRLATVESTNGDLASLSLGQSFDGYTIRAISDSDVTIESQDGKREKLRFVDPTVVDDESLRTKSPISPSVMTSNPADVPSPAPATDLGNANNNRRRQNRNQGNQ